MLLMGFIVVHCIDMVFGHNTVFVSKCSVIIYLIVSGFFSAVLRIWIYTILWVWGFFFPKYATKAIVLDPVSMIPHALASLFNFYTKLLLVCKNFIEISIDI